MQPGYYAIIPAEVRYDNDLIPLARLLYGEITALCNQNGFCWAENEYFANLYSKSPETISRWVSQLRKKSYIDVFIDEKSGNKRRITLLTKTSRPLDENVKTLLTKTSRPLDENVKPYIMNNITINNTENIYANALDFLKNENPSWWETFQMQNKSKIKNFEEFCVYFNNKFEEEERAYSYRSITGRLLNFTTNWLKNKNAEKKQFDQIDKMTNPNYGEAI